MNTEIIPRNMNRLVLATIHDIEVKDQVDISYNTNSIDIYINLLSILRDDSYTTSKISDDSLEKYNLNREKLSALSDWFNYSHSSDTLKAIYDFIDSKRYLSTPSGLLVSSYKGQSITDTVSLSIGEPLPWLGNRSEVEVQYNTGDEKWFNSFLKYTIDAIRKIGDNEYEVSFVPTNATSMEEIACFYGQLKIKGSSRLKLKPIY